MRISLLLTKATEYWQVFLCPVVKNSFGYALPSTISDSFSLYNSLALYQKIPHPVRDGEVLGFRR